MNTTQKGDIAELAVATDLTKRGYQVAFPFGTSLDWDLGLIRGSRIERVQVKYSSILANGTVKVRAYVTTHTGRAQYKVRSYAAGDFDYLAVYCPDVEQIYYVSVSQLPAGGQMYLRVNPPKTGSDLGKIRWAGEYTTI